MSASESFPTQEPAASRDTGMEQPSALRDTGMEEPSAGRHAGEGEETVEQQETIDDRAAGTGARVPLLAADELASVVDRWRGIQAAFVDEPRRAVQDADALVSDLMGRLARTFAAEREQLEARWSDTDDISTEDLRQGLQRYRSFFERLLAA